MNPILIAGTSIVNLALISYTIAIILLYKKRTVARILTFFTIGVILDITATICMIMGSSKGIITAHGLVGYSSLLGMLIETSMLWKKFMVKSELTAGLRKFSFVVYFWWIAAYITGAVIVALRHHQ